MIKSSTINKYTFQDDGKRWLKKYDAIRFNVGFNKYSESALVEISNAIYDFEKQTIVYSLGKVIDVVK